MLVVMHFTTSLVDNAMKNFGTPETGPVLGSNDPNREPDPPEPEPQVRFQVQENGRTGPQVRSAVPQK